MPYYLHQWSYHDRQVRQIVVQRQDREQVVRDAVESFDGELLHFYFCLGEYDAMAISKFPDNERAMACLLLVFGEGAVRKLRTTPLVDAAEATRAIQRAHDETKD
jgi:uncharacterized protein with GYD domain